MSNIVYVKSLDELRSLFPPEMLTPLDCFQDAIADILAKMHAQEDHDADVIRALATERHDRRAAKARIAELIRQQTRVAGVYVAQSGDRVKIGVSSHVHRRIAALQRGMPDGLFLHAVLPGGASLEQRLHRYFQHLRTRGEWFRRDAELNDWIERGCPRNLLKP